MYYALVGYGVSNKALCEKLISMGHKIFVSELRKFTDEEKEWFSKKGIDFEEGKNSDRICEADRIVVSPSVRFDHPALAKCRGKTFSDIEVVLDMNKPNFVIAVTGSNGKTTSCKLLSFVFQKLGLDSYTCGNIGTPAADVLGFKTKYLVLEISSFQLFWSKMLHIDIGVVLNIQPNHLDWHPSLEHYAKSKLKLLEFSKTGIYNCSDQNIMKFISEKSNLCAFDPLKIRKVDDGIVYEGEYYTFKNDFLKTHQNLQNLSAILKIFSVMNFDLKQVLEILEDFKPLKHRMEFVDEINGVVFLNDSKATSSAATISALENFNSRNVILLLTGRGKNEDYADLIAQIKRKAKHVIVFGEMVELLRDELKLSDIPYTISENMQKAVLKAFEISEKGDVVLLSPAGASFDMYRNYQERGEHFVNMVKLLRGKLLE